MDFRFAQAVYGTLKNQSFLNIAMPGHGGIAATGKWPTSRHIWDIVAIAIMISFWTPISKAFLPMRQASAGAKACSQ